MGGVLYTQQKGSLVFLDRHRSIVHTVSLFRVHGSTCIALQSIIIER